MLDLQKLNRICKYQDADEHCPVDIFNAMTFRLMVYVSTRQSVLEFVEKYGWQETVAYLKNSDNPNAVYFLSVAEHLQHTDFGNIGIGEYDRFFAELPESWTSDFVQPVLDRLDFFENGCIGDYDFFETSKKPPIEEINNA